MSSDANPPSSSGPLAEAVLQAWRDWDARPAQDVRAWAMVEACHAYAGIYSRLFRMHLSTARRAGLTREQALYSWEFP